MASTIRTVQTDTTNHCDSNIRKPSTDGKGHVIIDKAQNAWLPVGFCSMLTWFHKWKISSTKYTHCYISYYDKTVSRTPDAKRDPETLGCNNPILFCHKPTIFFSCIQTIVMHTTTKSTQLRLATSSCAGICSLGLQALQIWHWCRSSGTPFRRDGVAVVLSWLSLGPALLLSPHRLAWTSRRLVFQGAHLGWLERWVFEGRQQQPMFWGQYLRLWSDPVVHLPELQLGPCVHEGQKVMAVGWQ